MEEVWKDIPKFENFIKLAILVGFVQDGEIDIIASLMIIKS